MRSPRRTPEPRTAEEILANPNTMALLAAVAAGRVYRGEDGFDLSATALHLLDGRPVRFQLRRLADHELIRIPMSGPPKMTDYGSKILGRLGELETA